MSLSKSPIADTQSEKLPWYEDSIVQSWWPVFKLLRVRPGGQPSDPRKQGQPRSSPGRLPSGKVFLRQGDITKFKVDAIVNAAKNSLLGGGGVDGAIHAVAGTELKEACMKLGGCRTGEAKITKAFKLPSKYVIHTVGPKDQSEQKLRNCYISCLDLMKLNKLRSIVFPSIATGMYGYPVDKASKVALTTVKEWLQKGNNSDCVDRIVFCVYSKRDFDVYMAAAAELAVQAALPVNRNGLPPVAKSQSPRK